LTVPSQARQLFGGAELGKTYLFDGSEPGVTTVIGNLLPQVN